MKLSKLFFGLATAAMFAACSSDDIVAEQQNQIEWNENGMGYMAFSVTMPEQAAARAENDKFDNGKTEEYAVNNVTLLLFDGTKFHSAYDLGNDPWTGANTDTNPNVTADNKFIAKVKGEGIANPYAFVVLNHNGIFSVDPASHTLAINGVTIAENTEFSVIQAKTAKNDLDLQATDFHKEGFLMMNSPLMSNAGGADVPVGSVWTLAKVNANAIYKTEAAAKEATLGSTAVYVERAVAKVTLTAEDKIGVSEDFGKAEVTGWTLDNTNKGSYLVRQETGFNSWLGYNAPGTTANNKYRMVGTANVEHNAPITEGTAGDGAFRTYWAQDVNYTRTAAPTVPADLLAWQKARYEEFNPYTAFSGTVGGDMYCAENTFDVAHMVYAETTRALVAVKLTPKTGTSFYSRPGDNKVYSEAQMLNAAQAYAVAELGLYGEDLEGTPAYSKTKVDDETFKVTITGVSKKSTAPVNAIRDALVAALAAGKEYKVTDFGYTFYKDGVAYYDVRIQHFGDDCTPWLEHDAATVEEAYGDGTALAADAENNWLGRWGVLRNNWYNLNVTNILKVGYADPADLDLDPTTPDGPDPDTPDDNKKSEQWISVDVNILSWAKRFQNVEW